MRGPRRSVARRLNLESAATAGRLQGDTRRQSPADRNEGSRFKRRSNILGPQTNAT